MKRVWSCLAFLPVFLLPASARAQGVPFRVEYRAVPGCPGEDAFASQVVQRSRQLRLAGESEAASVFELELSEHEGGFAGTLRLREQNDRTTQRELSSASCDEVVSALALIAAVLIDPASDPATGAREAPARDTAPARGAPARRSRPKPKPKPLEAPKSAAPSPKPKLAQSTADARVSFRAGLGVALEDAVAPGVAPAFFAELQAALVSNSAFNPLLALQLERSLTSSAETRAGTADLTWTAARLVACPVRWPPAEFLAIRPCASVEAGYLNAAGTDTTERTDSNAFWFAPGANARLEARLMASWIVTLDAGAVFPMTRDRFYFDPDNPANTAFEVPAVGASGRLALILALN